MHSQNKSELENWHNFEIQARKEIVTILRSVGEKKQLVRILIHGESDVCVTSVLAVDGDGDKLILDCSIDAAQNKRILATAQVGFETSLDKIRILFKGGPFREVSYKGGPALQLPLPTGIVRLQR